MKRDFHKMFWELVRSVVCSQYEGDIMDTLDRIFKENKIQIGHWETMNELWTLIDPERDTSKEIAPDMEILDEQDPQFDRTIGQLDFILSKLMGYAKNAEAGYLTNPNRQTLKHHAEDMEAAAKAIFKKLGINQESTPQPE